MGLCSRPFLTQGMRLAAMPSALCKPFFEITVHGIWFAQKTVELHSDWNEERRVRRMVGD